ncbi:MAG: hypothetical protein H6838_18890 [Planctomycetes bacterium]|nr:hypothetical protein [Planctomycetota bacterium]MCB9887565.1 hypothetical protein [Planctomycetota bacterium]
MKNVSLGGLTLAIACSPLAAQWNQASPATSPSARSGHALCYDSTGNRALLFGGSAGFSTSNETWSFDGSNWTQLSPIASPTGKTGMELVHDPIRGVTVMYGSMSTSFFGGPSVDETWEFDGTTWTQVFPVTTPGGLGNYGACYDLLRQRVVIYGGSADSFFPIAESGTWEFDGTNWTQMQVPATPGPLERPSMCFSINLGKTVMFGGIDPQIGGNDTTWLYDGTSWTAANVVGVKPSPRTGAEMVYDSNRGVCVLSGGVDPMTGQAIVETWEFDGTSWAQMPSVNTGRYGHSMAYLPAQKQVLQFGGIDPSTFSDLADTWEYGAKSRTFGTGCAGSNGVPALAAVDAPRLGATYTLNVTNLVPSSAFAFMATGLSDQTGPFGALPFSLAGFGMPGCSALVSGEALVLIPATAGTATWNATMPNAAAFMGLTLFQQAISFDAAANAAGLTVSNAHAGVVGR